MGSHTMGPQYTSRPHLPTTTPAYPHLFNHEPATYERGEPQTQAHADWYNDEYWRLTQGHGRPYMTPGGYPAPGPSMSPHGPQTYTPSQSASAPPDLAQPDQL